jgi:hypothetical protein
MIIINLKTAYNNNAFANKWTALFVCLGIKLILKFANKLKEILHIFKKTPKSKWVLSLL